MLKPCARTLDQEHTIPVSCFDANGPFLCRLRLYSVSYTRSFQYDYNEMDSLQHFAPPDVCTEFIYGVCVDAASVEKRGSDGFEFVIDDE